MKVFMTGASGFIGSHVTPLLREAGHEVTALVRSDKGVAELQALGVTVVKGELESYDLIGQEAGKADAVIHLGFIHDFSRHGDAVQVELKVVNTILSALKGTNKPFIASSGAAAYGDHADPVDESTPTTASWGKGTRGEAEQLILEGAKLDVRTVLVRLAMYTYGKDAAALIRLQEGKAVELGSAIYADAGANSMPFVHVEDAAQLYFLALQHAKAGTAYNCTSGQATGREIAEAIAAKKSLPTKSISKEEMMSGSMYGPFLGMVFCMNNVVSCAKAHKDLQWRPQHAESEFLQIVAGKGFVA